MPRPNTLPLALALALAALAGGCSEFATPAELSRPQVLALRAEPPTIGPGGGAALLTALVAGPDGIIESDTRWSVADGEPASIEEAANQIWLVAAAAAEDGDVITVNAIATAGDLELAAVRTVAVRSGETSNPTVDALRAGGAPVADGELVSIRAGEAIDLEVEMSPATDAASVAWYATLGEISRYRQSPAELVADEGGSGWLIVVVRDGAGGIDWTVRGLEVEP